ncbi:MAG TPA: hypothetical protein VFU31_29855 [Candidatus Binatia bacterium]|nr:hypothetical protein [Candidatus Binatia bacterium]
MKITNGVAWHPTGFRLEVDRITGSSERFLKVNDLNPEAQIYFRLSRMECLRLGLLLAWRALVARTPAEQARRATA